MIAMVDAVHKATDVIFTAYMVPALLVPFVWTALRVGRALRSRKKHPAAALLRLERIYSVFVATWVGVWLATRIGLPLEHAGRPLLVLSWIGFAGLNVAFAVLMIRFASDYSDVPDGREKDLLFLRLLGIVVLQPVTTACAFAVLYHAMGVAYRLYVPALSIRPLGI